MIGRSVSFLRNLQTSASARITTVDASSNSTVNPSEVAHFSRLSSLWWDEHGEFKLLHRMNPVRMQFLREKLTEVALDEQGESFKQEVFKGLDVLDVGCGGGLLSESLARLGAKTLGIDASESNVAIARNHASSDPRLSFSSSGPSNLQYQHTSAEALVKEDKRFDVVCSMEVLEHVDNPAGFLSACAELVKPGGHMFLSTIARTPLSYLLTILMAEHVLHQVTPGTHTHSKYVNPSELLSFFQSYPVPRNGGSPTTTDTRPWVSRTDEQGRPRRTEAEVRGIVYLPWKGQWVLMPREASIWGGAQCNYLFWVRKPME